MKRWFCDRCGGEIDLDHGGFAQMRVMWWSRGEDIYEMAYHEFPSAVEAAFADRMRELGIEVDG